MAPTATQDTFLETPTTVRNKSLNHFKWQIEGIRLWNWLIWSHKETRSKLCKEKLAMLRGKMLFFMSMKTQIFSFKHFKNILYVYILCFLLNFKAEREHLEKHKLKLPANPIHHV